MSLHLTARHRLGRIALDVTLDVGRGLTALVGPSGAGKTTVLHVIAGLIRPDAGLVRLDADVLADTAAGIWIPPHRRRIGYVTQDTRLFPHLTVRRNLQYGRWFAPAPAGRVALDDVVRLLDLAPLLDRRPSKLSGGEQQRVALGRAILSGPRLLLLDEPLAAVDVGRRQDILPYLDRLRGELTIPAIYVTHSLAEISGSAETVISMDEGRVTRVETSAPTA